MKPRTTLKLTSASSSATRTSRSASWMLSSVSRPCPPRRSKIDCSLVLRDSNMERRSLRNYAEHFNSWARRSAGERALRRGGVASAARAQDTDAHGLPAKEQQYEAERQQQGGHAEPEITLPPARPHIPPPEPQRSQESHGP